MSSKKTEKNPRESKTSISFYGLSPEEVIKAAFQVPDPIPPKKRSRSKPKKAKKK